MTRLSYRVKSYEPHCCDHYKKKASLKYEFQIVRLRNNCKTIAYMIHFHMEVNMKYAIILMLAVMLMAVNAMALQPSPLAYTKPVPSGTSSAGCSCNTTGTTGYPLDVWSLLVILVAVLIGLRKLLKYSH